MRYLNRNIATLALFILTCLAFLPHSYASVRIRFHHDMAVDSALHLGVVKFKEELEHLSNHSIQVDVFAADALGDDHYATELLQIGIVQAAVIPTSKLANFVPLLRVLDYPYLFKNKSQAYSHLDGNLGDKLIGEMPAKGIVGFGFWESGFKQLTCNNIIAKSGDDLSLKNVSVRIMASDILEKQYRAVGALPLVIPFSETYVSLQHGITRCQENPLVSIAKMRLYEVQDEMILSQHAYLAYAFIVSRRWYSSLTSEQQSWIRQAEFNARQYQRAMSSQLEHGYLEEITQSNMTKLYPESRLSTFEARFRQMPIEKSLVPLVDAIRENKL